MAVSQIGALNSVYARPVVRALSRNRPAPVARSTKAVKLAPAPPRMDDDDEPYGPRLSEPFQDALTNLKIGG
jgi:hypothetical protein